MNSVLQVFFIIVVLVFLAIIVRYLGKKSLDLKYSLVWLATCLVMLVLVLFPNLVQKIGRLVGIATPVNTVFVFAVIFMMLIIFTLTVIVSHLSSRIYRLAQIQAILEKRIRDLEDKKQ